MSVCRLAAAVARRRSLPRRRQPPASATKAQDIVDRAIDGFIRPGYARLPSIDVRALREPARHSAPRRRKPRSRRHGPRSARPSTPGRRDRDHPLRSGHRREPAGTHPVLAGSQGHRPEAGAGSARRQGPDGDRCRATGATRASPCRGSARSNSSSSAPAPRRSATGDAHRCAYGAAIAGNLDAIAAELDAAWAAPDGFASIWANPSAQQSAVIATARRP